MKITRRNFAGLGAAFVCAGGRRALGFPAITAVRSPNGQVRHLSVGCGNMARVDIESFRTHPKIEMAAFCDVDANYLGWAKSQFPKARFYRDWREMFAAEGDTADSVNVSAPDHHHIHMAAAALRLRKHLYLQKPMAKTMQEAAFLRAAAREAGVVTQMGTQFAATSSDRQVVEMLRAGTLGPVERAYLFSTRKGVSRRRRLVPTAAAVPATLDWDLWLGSAAARPYAEGVYHPRLWRIWRDLGSGWIGDIGCHLISAVWLGMDLGGTAPRDVLADTLTDAEDGVKERVWPTSAHILWHFPGVPASGGAPFVLEWFDGCSEPDALAPARYRPPAEIDALFARTPFKTRPQEGKAVKCRDGWILQPHGSATAYVIRNDGAPMKAPVCRKAPTHYHEFIDCCLAGRPARSDFAWATHMREAVIAGEIAERRAGVRLVWDAAARRFDDAAANAFLTRAYREGWDVPGMV